jgi:L-alanine-DL-glutamate epimerase-like enolase superfamily enzyme
MARRPKAKRPTASRTSVKRAARSASGEKVRAHRERMRKRGFRLLQLWVPDTRSKEFAERAHRASLAIANSASDAEDQAFLDSVSWWNSPEARALEALEPDTPWWREPSDT